MKVVYLDEVALRTRIADRLLELRMSPTEKEAHARADAVVEGMSDGHTELEIEGVEYRLRGGKALRPRLSVGFLHTPPDLRVGERLVRT